MPLPDPDDDITVLQIQKWISHLESDPEFAPFIDLPILEYPPDGWPTTHPERVVSIYYQDSDETYMDNASNKLDNVFCIRLQIKERAATHDAIRAAHSVACNMKDVLTQAIWRYRKDDCAAPGALWWRLQFASPSARLYRNREIQCQVVEVAFKITSTHLNRPK